MSALNVAEVVEAIGWPWERWPGSCYAVAVAMLRAGVVDGEPRYGSYLGDVSPDCPVESFRSCWAGGVGVRHGWIEQADGTIVDPTRWVFMGWRSPCVFVIPPGDPRHADYDVAAQAMARMLRRPPPRRGEGDNPSQEAEVDLGLSFEAMAHVRALLGDESDRPPTWLQWHWVGNAPIDDLGPHAREVYLAMKADREHCLGASVPLDHYDHVMDLWSRDVGEG